MPMKYKYPRTPHLSWSLGYASQDDLVLENTRHFHGMEVVVTEKMDGENTNMYTDYLHARSINYRPHPSRDWVKKLHSNIAHLIPSEWRLCGENVYARHSIVYENLDTYFYLFSIWDEHNTCLNWQQTLEWADLLGLKTPREFYKGVWDEKLISNLQIDTERCEGYVVRTCQSFSYDTFDLHVAKWVRKEHVTTDQKWLNQVVIPNCLQSSILE